MILDLVEHRLGEALRIHLRIRQSHPSLWVDYISNPACMLIIRCFTRPIKNAYFFLGVTQNRERKTELLHKRLVLGFGIKRNAQHHRIFIGKFLDSIPESTPFKGSARGIGFGEKPQHDVFSSKILKTDRFAIMGFDCEVWS